MRPVFWTAFNLMMCPENDFEFAMSQKINFRLTL